MRKYFYTNGTDKFGPFSLEDFKKQNLSRDTKIWYYGLPNWLPISEIEELKEKTPPTPPPLPKQPKQQISSPPLLPKTKKKKSKKKTIFLVISSVIVVLALVVLIRGNWKEKALYKQIVESSYETNEDFNFYIDKFYRDIDAYGLFPKRPSKTIVKFAKLDKITDATHIHGISFGFNNDDVIEIYINPSTWKNFSKPKRYYLMYHELAHDVLNVDDLENLPKNKGKLMFPAISTYGKISMDDFIEASHTLFEEVADKNK